MFICTTSINARECKLPRSSSVYRRELLECNVASYLAVVERSVDDVAVVDCVIITDQHVQSITLFIAFTHALSYLSVVRLLSF